MEDFVKISPRPIPQGEYRAIQIASDVIPQVKKICAMLTSRKDQGYNGGVFWHPGNEGEIIWRVQVVKPEGESLFGYATDWIVMSDSAIEILKHDAFVEKFPPPEGFIEPKRPEELQPPDAKKLTR